jgi:hypothetical protein
MQHEEVFLKHDFMQYKDTIMNLKSAARATGTKIPQEILDHLENEKLEYREALKNVRKEMLHLGVKRLKMMLTK